MDLAASLGHERLELGTPVDLRPVPDDQQPSPDRAAQMAEERDPVQSIRLRRPRQRRHLALRRHAPQDRQMVARLPLIQDRRLSPRGVGLDHPRHPIEARFVHENKGPALAVGLLSQRGPGLDPPALDRLVVLLDRASDGDLRCPSQV